MHRTALARDFLDGLVDELFPDPVASVEGSHNVDVIVNRKNDTLCVNLVNTSGPHEDDQVFVIDTIDPVGPLDVTIRSEDRPSSVKLEPGDRKVDYSYSNGQISLTIPKLDIHDVIVVD